ncbi:hypothetical protein [Nocardioides campestrisoli]|uniref:hypothetical protein n=1 Tax=Nocardioides campestrisoli TaxID=2736757 RepID=UPI00295E88F9|nr:hypothetical protein [Nocardioides campestrisoli]
MNTHDEKHGHEHEHGPGHGPGHGPDEGREGRGGGRGGGPRGRGRGGRRGGWQVADLPPADDAADWFAGRLPEGWFSDVRVSVDREEVLVVGTLSDAAAGGGELSGAEAEGRISRFRAETRDERIEIALEAEGRYQRKVSWGVRLGDVEALFTHVAAPVMTRLRQPERQVLDTLVDAGVARSRSDALAWAVRLVGEHADEWLAQLRDAMAEVDKLRGEGPAL